MRDINAYIEKLMEGVTMDVSGGPRAISDPRPVVMWQPKLFSFATSNYKLVYFRRSEGLKFAIAISPVAIC
jgi:hypothetical protein